MISTPFPIVPHRAVCALKPRTRQLAARKAAGRRRRRQRRVFLLVVAREAEPEAARGVGHTRMRQQEQAGG